MNMQIKRNILGTEVTIDLTEGEILDAHYEAERYNARETLNERLIQEITEELPAELFGRMVKEVMDEKELMDNNMGDHLIPAIEAVIRKHEEDLNKYRIKPWKMYAIDVTQTKKRTYTVRAKDEADAEQIFNEWLDHHTDAFDYDMSEMDVDDTDIGSAYECEGNPDYADITVEEGF